jgi:hypothetical protein
MNPIDLLLDRPLRRTPTLAAAAVIFCGTSGCLATGAPGGEDTAGRGDHLDGSAYTLWIHGRNPSQSTTPGDYADFSYWGDASSASGQNPVAVNWDGVSHIADSNDGIRRALDCFCTGTRSCVVAAHSAGDVQIGYALSLYGATDRDVTDGVPDASGTCTSTGTTQVGWNVSWVAVAGGAAGGTELADLGYWAVSDPLTSDLRTSTARSLYDHDDTQGAVFYMYAGAKGAVYSGVLAGQDDSVIAYHSAGGLSDTGSFCNPGDWFCDSTLELGDAPSSKGGNPVPKWANHQVTFRDDGEANTHVTSGSWSGIAGVMRDDIASYTNGG